MNNTIITKCVNGKLKAGDLVISSPNDDYACLIGRVMKINLVGTPEHEEETANDTDDVHVNFLEFDYPRKRIKEIERMFTELYGKKMKFRNCPLDDVIMAPNSLIRITGIDENSLLGLLKSEYDAACYGATVIARVKRQSETENAQSDIKTDLFGVIEAAVALAGYKVLDGDRDSVIIRHCTSDTDYEIKVEELIN